MIENTAFMMLIETLRKRKHLSVNELTEGIMSVKTYYRYKNNHTRITASKAYQLLLKMNAEMIDLLYYFIRYFNSDVYLEKFILSMIVGNHEFVGMALDKLISPYADSEDRLCFIDVLYHKYQDFHGLSDKNDYNKYINQTVAKLSFKQENLYTLFCHLIYYMERPEGNEDLATFMLKEYRRDIHYKQRLSLYLLSVNYLMRDLMRFAYSDMKEYKKTLDVYTKVAATFSSKRSIDLSNLYYAYYYYRINDRSKYESHLFKFLNYLYFSLDSKDLQRNVQLVKEVFNIDPKTFMRQYFNK